ncbi:Tyrosine-protein kinase transforming protein RYK [Geodia barretti]|uniref:Tyrosine-protein kinase transforming protein RYK n=1 Tax=Geodia barretti TaxID=519541 RepID=A0AA35RPP8_GEOBA|nr:Tyrosine-protein kinase transforming protein RYK [Geodia barretti]
MTSSDWQRRCFTMFSLKHTNVMSLRGVCVAAESPLLIMPFMINGSVLEFVQHHKDELLCISTEAKVEIARERLLKICHQISKGMEYLSLRNVVHRDLGASNCMIDNDGVIKVADFGLAKNMHGTDYFRQGKGEGEDEEVPIKWMAPESLEEDIYTEATDVWSFGVTVWEVFTCGRIPYIDIPVVHLLEALKGGQRLEKPQNEACMDEIYDTMRSCWSLKPTDRPKFLDLVGMLGTLLERSSCMCQTSSELDMSQFLHSNIPLSSPPTALTPPVIQEQDAEDEDDDEAEDEF